MTMASLIKNVLGKLSAAKHWEDFEYFDESWRIRIKEMAVYINNAETVMDLGCGKMWLRDYLHSSNLYIPVDYKNRGEGTIVCDFTKHQFPEKNADVIFVSGCLEYIADYKCFVQKACREGNDIKR